jgi:hypothetical protein
MKKSEDIIKRFTNHYKSGFPTGVNFTTTQNELDDLCKNGLLKNIGLDPNNKKFFAVIYEAVDQSFKIILTLPDHAFRGKLEVIRNKTNEEKV